MKYPNCVLFGHSLILNKEKIEERLYCLLEKVIQSGVKEFVVGRRGDFDILGLRILRRLRNKFEDIKISVVFNSLTPFRKEGLELSDVEVYYKDVETLVFTFDNVYYKNIIIETNKRLVDSCDLVVCYVDECKKRSGALKAVTYAKKCNKEIINIYKKEDDPYYGLTEEEKEQEYKKFINKK